jgi:glutamate/tyrosine decarboxylase-like PLP-dependent enzyme
MLASDRRNLPALLQSAQAEAVRFLEGLDERPAGHAVPAIEPLGLPEAGLGASGALNILRERYGPWMSGSPGPRYFAFVTGGTTPAALVGDWLTGAYDQNGSDGGESGARQLTLDASAMVRALLGLPEAFEGVFVTGATTSALVAMATARQWVGRQRGVDASLDGAHALGPVPVLSGTAHSSIPKALSVVGLGRAALRAVPTLADREAVDVEALDAALLAIEGEGSGPAVVVANAGTVNTCDFDDLRAVAALKRRHTFWLHVDGAFGTIAGVSPRYRPLLGGVEEADSITVDAHKWLNVPYDAAMILTRHLDLQGETFKSTGAYLPAEVRRDTLIHLTPENSQRLRALPTWMTLAAYGREGYREIVERCCDLAGWLGERIEESKTFALLAPVRLNGLCFALLNGAGAPRSAESVAGFLDRLRKDGTAFLTSTSYQGTSAVRVSISNWRTQQKDVERAWEAMERLAAG